MKYVNQDYKGNTLRSESRKKIMTIVSFSALAIIGVTIIWYLAYGLGAKPTYLPYEEVQMPKSPYISEERLIFERKKLPKYYAQIDRESVVQQTNLDKDNDDTSGARILTPEEAKIAIDKAQSKPYQDINTVGDTKVISATKSPEMVSDETVAVQVYENPTSDASVESVTISYSGISAETPVTAQTREGIVFSIDKSNSVVTLSDTKNNLGLLKIYISDQTQILINSQRIPIDDLRVGDVVVAQGRGYTKLKDLTAESISVVATYDLLSHL